MLNHFASKIHNSGVINVNPSQSQGQGLTDLESLLPILKPQEGTTFKFAEETLSMLNSDKKFLRYEQYFNGIRVEGGGIVLQSSSNDDNDDPCSTVLFMIAPHIFSNISIARTATIPSSSVSKILAANSILSQSLIIAPNIDNLCGYNLVWKTEYEKEGNGRIAYVDSHTGEILKDFSGDIHAFAPTQVYGEVDLDDSSAGGMLILESDDDRIRTIDWGSTSQSSPSSPVNETQWEAKDTHSENGVSWGNKKKLYQTHFAMSQALTRMDDLGITIDKVSVAVSSNENKVLNKEGSDFSHTFIQVGRKNGNSYGVVDVMGHELAHTLTVARLGSVGLAPRSLGEGIADMFGVVIESDFQGGDTDWIMGDDNSGLDQRDLNNPGTQTVNGIDIDMRCFAEVEPVFTGTLTSHPRSRPLSHWFFLASTSNGLGIRGTLECVIDAMATMMPSTSNDYPELRAAVMTVLLSEYGECSDEVFYTAKAWSDICVGPDDNNCVRIDGPHIVCEESNYAHFSVINPNPSVIYRWNFPLDWTVLGSGNSNSINGSSLTITGFDQESYYPSMQDIQVVNMTSYKRTERTLILRDCDGDDPTCEDIYGLNQQNDEHESVMRYEKKIESSKNSVKIYDLSGKLVFTGKYSDFEFSNIPTSSQILLVVNYDNFGNIINTTKKFFTKR